jgi:hypothetical protein
MAVILPPCQTVSVGPRLCRTESNNKDVHVFDQIKFTPFSLHNIIDVIIIMIDAGSISRANGQDGCKMGAELAAM